MSMKHIYDDCWSVFSRPWVYIEVPEGSDITPGGYNSTFWMAAATSEVGYFYL